MASLSGRSLPLAIRESLVLLILFDYFFPKLWSVCSLSVETFSHFLRKCACVDEKKMSATQNVKAEVTDKAAALTPDQSALPLWKSNGALKCSESNSFWCSKLGLESIGALVIGFTGGNLVILPALWAIRSAFVLLPVRYWARMAGKRSGLLNEQQKQNIYPSKWH